MVIELRVKQCDSMAQLDDLRPAGLHRIELHEPAREIHLTFVLDEEKGSRDESEMRILRLCLDAGLHMAFPQHGQTAFDPSNDDELLDIRSW
ncbi:MAG TPA: hypothetical protein VHZ54_14465 [Solirubrobacterales bacterium]|jgi:hypothetical protein|nr:hypothetical protein [Solirubrobacterales bacterium]